MTGFGKQLNALFDEAMEMGAEERARFVESIRAENTRLASALHRLIQHDEAVPEVFLNHDSKGASCSSDRNESIPEQIGRYRILREIGRGGMGVVYEAEQENPQRRVAVKVIRQELGLPHRIRRFRQEAHVLGKLQHTGIAQIFEAGSANVGRSELPFFAMELVDGLPLDQAVQGLTLREKLLLMSKVCDAVEHAHQKGVIHRDLKPANILVVTGASLNRQERPNETSSHKLPNENNHTPKSRAGSADRKHEATPSRLEETQTPDGLNSRLHESIGLSSSRTSMPTTTDSIGQPKILDFGIARLTNVDMMTVSMQTDVGQLIGTIPYMSPEQVCGDGRMLDTRSDVYALGVMLYELLTGQLPYQIKHRTVPEAIRIIREEDPMRVTAVDTALCGDLDAIVGKALEKDVDRRYQSAGALSADLRRYLADEPIEARPASAMYHARKFARRNKALVGGFAIAVCALAIGFALSLAGFVKASRERNEKESALRKEQAAREISDEVRSYLEQVLRSPSPDRFGHDVTVREVLDQAAVRVEDHFALRPRLAAELYITIGHSYFSLGLNEQAEQQFRRALELYDEVEEVDPLRLISIRNKLVGTYYGQGRFKEAIAENQSQLEWLKANNDGYDVHIAQTLNNLAICHKRTGEFSTAKDLLQESVTILERELAPDDLNVIKNKNLLVEILLREDRFDDADKLLSEIEGVAIKRFGLRHPRVLSIRNNRAILFMKTDPRLAIPHFEELLKDYSQVYSPSAQTTLNVYANLGVCLWDAERFDEAVVVLKQGLEVAERKYGAGSPATTTLRDRYQQAVRQLDETAQDIQPDSLPSQ
jgi:serine/threonine protein kinase/Tfp pilus assembly protein PilF